VQQHEEPVLDSARWIVTWHLVQDRQENEALADSDDGTPPAALLLGDRCRALASGPYRDGHRPRWAGAVAYAAEALGRASQERRAGLWSPGLAARHAAAALHPSLTAAPDAPPLPDGVSGATWVQRAVRLAHLHATIGVVVDHHGASGELSAHPHPFGSALAATRMALKEITATVRELEELWARREADAGVAAWERSHVPVAVREHVLALEHLIVGLSALCFDMFDMKADPDDEAH
jgi:hypothetical protein